MNEQDQRFKRCIVCDNDDFSAEASFCKKCGTSLLNFCLENDTTCGIVNSPDAFYCETCGSETSLLEVSAEQLQTDKESFVENHVING